MNKAELTEKIAATGDTGERAFSAHLLWRIVCSAFMGRENSSLRLTRTGGMELDMEHFLQREDVQQRLREADEFSIALGLTNSGRSGRKKTAKARKKPAKHSGRIVAR